MLVWLGCVLHLEVFETVACFWAALTQYPKNTDYIRKLVILVAPRHSPVSKVQSKCGNFAVGPTVCMRNMSISHCRYQPAIGAVLLAGFGTTALAMLILVVNGIDCIKMSVN